jgi:hypothetical protein
MLKISTAILVDLKPVAAANPLFETVSTQASAKRCSSRRSLADAAQRPDCLAGHIGLELANPSASYLIRST